MRKWLFIATMVIAAMLLLTACAGGPAGEAGQGRETEPHGATATINASGPVRVETGDWFSNSTQPGTGTISVTAVDFADGGGRVTPLPPNDKLTIDATIEAGGNTFVLRVREAMVEDPLGRYTTWWGVGFNVDHHGRSGIGSDRLPRTTSTVAAYGLGDLTLNGNPVAAGVPVHIMTLDSLHLELDVGDPDLSPIPGVPNGHLRVLWETAQVQLPEETSPIRYAIGAIVIGILLAGFLVINRREVTR